jgi:hypothetical protein
MTLMSEKDKRKKRPIVTAIIVFITVLVIIFMAPFTRSLVIMSASNLYNSRESIVAKEDIDIEIPIDRKNWYPLMLNFNAKESFSYWTKEDISLDIYYNFASFDLLEGCSRVYDPDSPYYSSFYGAYLVQRKDGRPYGFDPNDISVINVEEVERVARFDYTLLVLGDLGITKNQLIFDAKVEDIIENVEYAGSYGWSRVDTIMLTNGMLHHQKEKTPLSYLQYGSPSKALSRDHEDFSPIEMHGIVIGKWFPEYRCSIFFYIMSPNKEVCENWLEWCQPTISDK